MFRPPKRRASPGAPPEDGSSFPMRLPCLAALLFALVAKAEGSVVGCEDADKKCPEWAAQGECTSNAVWMMANCRKSCRSCQGGDRAWQLRQHIQSTYVNSTEQTTKSVKIESVRINNVEIDERRQNVKVFGRMVMSWNDSMVSWDKQKWGLSWLNFYWVQIWTPTIVQVNGGTTSNPAANQFVSKVLAANSTGQVYLWADFVFVSPQKFDYENFPNDVQTVCYKFDDKRPLAVHFSVSDGVKSKEREATTDPFVSGWKIVDVDVNESQFSLEALSDPKRNPFDVQSDNCELCISLRRNAVYFNSEMLLPSLLTSMFTVSAVFCQLSKRQPMILALSVVTQILGLVLISQRLPSFTAHTPTILRFSSFNLIMTGILFVATLVLEKLASTPGDIPPPHSVDMFVSLVDKFLPLPRQTKHEDNSLKYAPIAHAINHTIFIFTAVFYFLVVVGCFVF